MYLFCSDGEAYIELTSEESKELQRMVLNSKQGESQIFSSIQNRSSDHYERLLNTLELECNGSKIKGSILGDTLRLEY